MRVPHHLVFTGRMPFLPPNQQHQSTESKIFDKYFIANLMLSSLWKNFKNWSTYGKVMGKTVDCLIALCAQALSCWKMKLVGDLTYGNRRYVPTSVFRSLASAFVLNQLDCCNSLLVDLPANLLQHLQSVQNSAVRLIYRLRRSEHITDALLSLHWLRVR